MLPGAPNLDSEMGASREGANRGPRGQVFVPGVENRVPRPACWLGLATAPPLFETRVPRPSYARAG
jgi:hypothetical protein